MKIHTFATYNKLTGSHIAGCTAIVVDVLRASSSIVWAVRNGAEKIIPVSDGGTAAAIASRLGDCLLAGERNGLRIQGFDLGNSPLEFSRERVRGKTIVMSTSNGTGTIQSVEAAAYVLVGAMINATAVAKRAVELDRDILIMCAGTEGEFSADDICAAGAIAKAALLETQKAEVCDDLTRVAIMVYENWKSGKADLSATDHYSELAALGFQEDLEFCFTQDITDQVPEYKDGILR